MTQIDPLKKREYNRTYAARRKANFNWETAIHGTKATYDFGMCRCDECRTFNKARREHARIPFGVTKEQYDALLESQGGKCAICGKAGNDDMLISNSTRPRRLSVDHDHASGKIRGLLCFHCNTGLGKLGDSVEGLERALAYLKQTS